MPIPQEQLDESVATFQKFVNLLGLSAKATASADNDRIRLKVESEDPGRLIGRKGRTLSSIQTLVNNILRKDSDEFPRVLIDVDDYRQERDKGERPGQDDDDDDGDGDEQQQVRETDGEGKDNESGEERRGNRRGRGGRRGRGRGRGGRGREDRGADADRPDSGEQREPRPEAPAAPEVVGERAPAEAPAEVVEFRDAPTEVNAEPPREERQQRPEPPREQRQERSEQPREERQERQERPEPPREERQERPEPPREARQERPEPPREERQERRDDRGRRDERGRRDDRRDERGGRPPERVDDRRDNRAGRGPDRRDDRRDDRGPRDERGGGEDRLRQQVSDAVKEVRMWGEEVRMPPMSPDQCRQVIELLGEHKDIRGVAGPVEGGGRQRVVLHLNE